MLLALALLTRSSRWFRDAPPPGNQESDPATEKGQLGKGSFIDLFLVCFQNFHSKHTNERSR